MSAAPETFGFTFGASFTQKVWEDVRREPWERMVEMLTVHELGRKEGSCIVPGIFSGTERKKEYATQIDLAFLDSDTGVPLDEIVHAIKRQGWTAIISSTHSHLTAETEASVSNWDRYFRDNPGSEPEDFLREQKGYSPAVAKGATCCEDMGEYVIIRHWPCPKFRVVIPLAHPWKSADYPSQDAANAAWKSAIEALSASLGLPHDQSCTDTSRLFYLPRRSPNGAVPETEVIAGDACDIFGLVPPEPPNLLNGHGPKINGATQRTACTFEYADPETGEFIDLIPWAKSFGATFLMAKAIEARRPSMLRGIDNDGRIHIQCPNDGAHTKPQKDGATFVCDAGNGATKGFVIKCMHAHCVDHDRLFFLRRMLDHRWFGIEDLTSARFHIAKAADEKTPDADKPPLPLVWFNDIETVLDAKDFVQGVLVEQGSVVVYGESNAGKTFWTTDLALHVAAGLEWNGRRVEGGGVIYCVLEGGAGFRNRVAAWRDRTGQKDIPFAAVPASLNLLNPDADTPRLVQLIKFAAKQLGVPIKLVVIDTLSRAMAGGNENAPDGMGLLVQNMDTIRSETGACVVFVHHSGKDQARGARGHSLLRAAIDTEVEVVASETEDKVATVVKQREMKKGDAFGFTLKVVELGENRHGEKVTTCIVAPQDAIPDRGQRGTKKKPLAANASLGARALGIAMGKKGALLPPYSDYPEDTMAVSASEWKDEFNQLKAGSSDTNKHAFNGAETALLAARIITARNGLVWFVKRSEGENSYVP